MRILRISLILLTLMALSHPSFAEFEGEFPQDNPSGWFLGTDQGILFFTGDSDRFVNAQYYGTIYGGYNINGYFQPMLRIGQAIGSMSSFGNPTSFWFIMEGGFRATPLRTMVRPYFMGTAGFYVLSYDQFANPVAEGVNFTFSGGGGLEVAFGHSALTVGGAYRGFTNSGPYLNSVEITLGYRFQF